MIPVTPINSISGIDLRFRHICQDPNGIYNYKKSLEEKNNVKKTGYRVFDDFTRRAIDRRYEDYTSTDDVEILRGVEINVDQMIKSDKIIYAREISNEYKNPSVLSYKYDIATGRIELMSDFGVNKRAMYAGYFVDHPYRGKCLMIFQVYQIHTASNRGIYEVEV